jgi:hypothetical protein
MPWAYKKFNHYRKEELLISIILIAYVFTGDSSNRFIIWHK